MSARDTPNWFLFWSIFTHLPNKHKISSPLAKPLPWNWWLKEKSPREEKHLDNSESLMKSSYGFCLTKKLDSENALERKRLPAWMGGLIFWREWRFAMRSISYLNFRTLLSWWFQTTLLKNASQDRTSAKIGCQQYTTSKTEIAQFGCLPKKQST